MRRQLHGFVEVIGEADGERDEAVACDQDDLLMVTVDDRRDAENNGREGGSQGSQPEKVDYEGYEGCGCPQLAIGIAVADGEMPHDEQDGRKREKIKGHAQAGYDLEAFHHGGMQDVPTDGGRQEAEPL